MHRTRAILLVGLVAVSTLAVPATAATETAVSLQPSSGSVDVGESVTFDVVVGTVKGGVGAYAFWINVSDRGVAAISSVDLSPSNGEANADLTVSGDNSSVNIATFGAETTGSGSDVPIATVTVRGKAAGSTDLVLNVTNRGLADAGGTAYTVSAEEGATVTVGGGDGGSGNGDGGDAEGGDGGDGGGDGGDGSGTTGIGFGILVAIVALLGGSFLLARR